MLEHTRIRILLVSVLLTLLLTGMVLAQSVQISEVNPAGQWVELHNSGEEAVDVSELWLCNRPAYSAIKDLEIVTGELVIPPGGYLVVSWGSIAPDAAELGLYSSRNFGSAEALLDYLEWGSAGHGRESVAVTAGLWAEGLFVAVPEGEMSLIRVTDAESASDRWIPAEPTPGAANMMTTSSRNFGVGDY